MRQKKAKMLRKIARERTQGLPERVLIHSAKVHTTAENKPESTRAVYRHLKKLYALVPKKNWAKSFFGKVGAE